MENGHSFIHFPVASCLIEFFFLSISTQIASVYFVFCQWTFKNLTTFCPFYILFSVWPHSFILFLFISFFLSQSFFVFELNIFFFNSIQTWFDLTCLFVYSVCLCDTLSWLSWWFWVPIFNCLSFTHWVNECVFLAEFSKLFYLFIFGFLLAPKTNTDKQTKRSDRSINSLLLIFHLIFFDFFWFFKQWLSSSSKTNSIEFWFLILLKCDCNL